MPSAARICSLWRSPMPPPTTGPSFRRLAPGGLQLIDYWHACQHLKCVADHAFGGDPAAAETWFQKYRGILGNDEDGVERVIRAIRYRHAANGKSVAALERELKFFRKHRRRMRYAVHQANHLLDRLRRRRERMSNPRQRAEKVWSTLGNGRRAGGVDVARVGEIRSLRRRLEDHRRSMENVGK